MSIIRKPIKRPRKREEAYQQELLFYWAQHSLKEYDLMFHIPNGGSRNRLEAISLKRQGVKRGIPDIFLAVPRGNFHGIFIEMKSTTGKLSKHQKIMINLLLERGYMVHVCRSSEEAKSIIGSYLDII